MRMWVTALVVTVAGGLSGFSGAVLAARLNSSPPPQLAREALPSTSKPRVDPADESCEMPRQPLRSAPSTSSSAAAPMAPENLEPPRMNREEQLVLERDLQSMRLQAHLQEPRDPSWAVPIETSLRESLEQLREGSTISYENLECRYLSCKANLTWPSLKDARADLERVASLQDGLPCTRFAVLDDMAAEGKVTGSVVFDCEHARLGAPDNLAQVERK